MYSCRLAGSLPRLAEHLAVHALLSTLACISQIHGRGGDTYDTPPLLVQSSLD